MIPEDAAERMARKLREIGLVDPEDNTMPIFSRRDDLRGVPPRANCIDYWKSHHEVAKALVDEVRSWVVPRPHGGHTLGVETCPGRP